MIPKIDESVIREMDVVLTTGRGLLSYIIKSVTAGFKFRKAANIATHAGFIVKKDGKWMIGEVTGEDNGGVVSPFEKYYKHGKFERRILAVRRSTMYNSPTKRKAANERAIQHLDLITYDYAGAGSFWIKTLQQAQRKYYCSEWVRYELSLDNIPVSMYNLISPYYLQTWNMLRDVSGAVKTME